MTADRLTEIDATAAPIVTAFAYAATVDLVPYLHVAYADRLERQIAAPLRAAIGDAIGAVAQLELLLDRERERELIDADWEASQRLTDELWRGRRCLLRGARRPADRADRARPPARRLGAAVVRRVQQPCPRNPGGPVSLDEALADIMKNVKTVDSHPQEVLDRVIPTSRAALDAAEAVG